MKNALFKFCPLFLKIRQDIDSVNLQSNSRRISTKDIIGNAEPVEIQCFCLNTIIDK